MSSEGHRDRPIDPFRDETPGFVAVVDGGERSFAALSVAAGLANWYGRACRVIATCDSADPELGDHLADNSLEAEDVLTVGRHEVESTLLDLMVDDQIVVAAAFGVWKADESLHTLLAGLVQHDAPALVGVGPNVAHDWTPAGDGPILVCVDATEHAGHLVDRLEPFLVPARAKVVVAHIDADPGPRSEIADRAGHSAAQRVADDIHRRFGMPVRAVTVPDDSATAGIAILASRLRSRLVVTHSWHRPHPGEPTVSSVSLTTVAHASCPVVVLGPPTAGEEMASTL